MKRRDFNTSVAAIFTIPALPANAAGAPAAIAPPAAKTGLYAWSVKIAETHGQCSADMLARMLRVDLDKAKSLFSALVRNNAVGPANAAGIGLATKVAPAQTGINSIANTNLAKSTRVQMKTARARIRKTVEGFGKDDAQAPHTAEEGHDGLNHV